METLPQIFKNNGYHTESIGKVYHVGHGNTNDTESWSVPHYDDKVIEYLVPESNNRELTREEALFENYNLYAKEKIDIKTLPRGPHGNHQMFWMTPMQTEELLDKQ